MTETKSHPAPFSSVALEEALKILKRRSRVSPGELVQCIDLFAGEGNIHRLMEMWDGIETYGIELEPEWAHKHPRTEVGRAEDTGYEDEQFDAAFWSPAFANRLADKYDGKGKCKTCNGVGHTLPGDPQGAGIACEKCKGTGVDQSKRVTYVTSLERQLTEGSGAGMRWNADYRDLHTAVLVEQWRILKPGAPLIVDIKDHAPGRLKPKEGQEKGSPNWQGVVTWWVGAMVRTGFDFLEEKPYPVESMTFGKGSDLRTDNAWLLVARKPRTGTRRGWNGEA